MGKKQKTKTTRQDKTRHKGEGADLLGSPLLNATGFREAVYSCAVLCNFI
jgi:hypothetical protein